MDSERSLRSIHVDWSCLVGESRRLREPAFRAEALRLSRRMMGRARDGIARIVDRLNAAGYRFVDPPRAHVGPEPGLEEWFRDQEARGIHVPMSMQGWLLEVGGVNLMGSHPEWPHPAYLFTQAETSEGVWYTDPLVVELSRESILEMHADWLYRRKEDGDYGAGPFRLEFAPDSLHKANVSGGPPYEVDAFEPLVDSLVHNDPRGQTFVAHVRDALAWGGFPGFRYIPDAPEAAKRIAEPLF